MPAPELSDTEAATVARFDAAPDAPESLRERTAEAICAADETIDGDHWTWADTDEDARRIYRAMADAALSVLRGDDWQHVMEPTCRCGPVPVGTVGAWKHR